MAGDSSTKRSRVQHVEHLGALGLGQGSRLSGPPTLGASPPDRVLVVGAGSASPATGPTTRTPSSSARAPRARPRLGRSRLRPRRRCPRSRRDVPRAPRLFPAPRSPSPTSPTSRRSRSISASSSAILRSLASGPGRPRFFARPSIAPAAACLRHSEISDEYKPSRRNNAPFSPSGSRSYSARIRALYSAGNRRRVAFGGTSISGTSLSSITPADSIEPFNATIIINFFPRPRGSVILSSQLSHTTLTEGD